MPVCTTFFRPFTAIRSDGAGKLWLSAGVFCLLLSSVAGESKDTRELPELLVEEARAAGERLLIDLDNDPWAARLEPGYEVGVTELAKAGTGFQISDAGAQSFGDVYTVRGLANTPFFSDRSVGIYWEEVPLKNSLVLPSTFCGVDRMTLIMGPQGDRFGQGGEAGVVFFGHRQGGKEMDGAIKAEAGEHGWRSFDGHVAGPAGGHVRYAVGASHFQRDGFIYNRTLDLRPDSREETAASLVADWQATPMFSIGFRGFVERARDGVQPLVPLGSRYEVERPAEGQSHVDRHLAALVLRVDRGNVEVVSTTGRTRGSLGPYGNVLSLGPVFFDSKVDLKEEAWIHETRLAASLNDSTRLSGGVYGSELDTHGFVDRVILGIAPFELSSYEIRSRELAGFGRVEHVAGAFTLGAGLRAESMRKNFSRVEQIPVPRSMATHLRDTAWLPTLSAGWEVTDGVKVNLKATRSRRPGGFSAFTGREDLAAFAPERVAAFDLGIAGQPADTPWHWAVRAFHYKITNYQIERSFTQADYIVVNAPRALSQGGEASMTWTPGSDLSLYGGVAVADTRLREFTDPFTGTRADGNRAPFVSKYTGTVAAAWKPESGWYARAQVSFASRVHYDEMETSLFTQGSRRVVDATFGYRTGRYEAFIKGENLFDEEYYTSIVPGVFHGAVASPRLIRGGVGFRF